MKTLAHPPGATRVTLRCNECGHTWRVGVNPKYWPVCPDCHSVDWDVKP